MLFNLSFFEDFLICSVFNFCQRNSNKLPMWGKYYKVYKLKDNHHGAVSQKVCLSLPPGSKPFNSDRVWDLSVAPILGATRFAIHVKIGSAAAEAHATERACPNSILNTIIATNLSPISIGGSWKTEFEPQSILSITTSGRGWKRLLLFKSDKNNCPLLVWSTLQGSFVVFLITSQIP